MLTFVWSWTRHWLLRWAWGGVGWGCERSFAVEHAIDATLSMGWGGDVNVRLKLNTPLMLGWARGGVGMWTFVWSWTRHWCYAEHGVGWAGVGMLMFVWSWTRHWCYAEHGVGWGCERSFAVEHAIDATLSMGWGGVGMLTFVWSWTRHWCYAEHGVGWGCERSFAVEHAIAATLSMGWGGVGMLTFVWSWTRHWCSAEHGVGWGCERSFAVEHAIDATLSMGWGGVGMWNVRLKLNTPLMLRWAWGGMGMWTFVCSWRRHWCYAEHGVGWGGDVNVRLKLNTPLMLGWAWGGVGMWTFVWSWTRLFVSWPVEKTAQVYMHNDHWNWQGKKRSGFRVEGLPNARKMTFLKNIFTLRRLRNTERVVTFWPWWCAYTRDSAPGGMFIIYKWAIFIHFSVRYLFIMLIIYKWAIFMLFPVRYLFIMRDVYHLPSGELT